MSLLPVDIKLLAKDLADRLSRVVVQVVHEDQSGCMPNRSTATNLTRLFLNIQVSSNCTVRGAVLSLNTAKAFDSVKGEFLWAVLLCSYFLLTQLRGCVLGVWFRTLLH